MRRYIALLVILSSALASGCVSVRVHGSQVPEQVFKLALTNRKLIKLQVTVPQTTSPAIFGHQYLLIFIPFGRIIVPELEASLFNKAYTALSISGYRIAERAHPHSPTIHIQLKKFQLTAYDYIFRRKIYCAADYEIQRIDQNGALKYADPGKVVVYKYKSMAFKRELEHVYNLCLQEVIDHALNSKEQR